MPKNIWRDYLKGDYKIESYGTRNKMRYELRRRTKQMMRDLLLVCQRMSREDKIRIFLDPVFWEKTAKPLIMELENNSSILKPDDPDYEEIRNLVRGLMLRHIPFDQVQLVDDKGYRERRKQKLMANLEELEET